MHPSRYLAPLLAALAACAPADGPSGHPVVEGPPRIVLETEQIDLGLVSDGGTYTATFPFHNGGSEVLEIRELDTGCKCVTASVVPTTVQPGGEGVVTVVFAPTGQVGPNHREVSMLANVEAGRAKIVLNAEVDPLVRFQPLRHDFGEHEPGTPAEFRFEVRTRLESLEFLPIETPEGFTATVEVKEDEGDESLFDVVLATAAMPWGYYEGGGAMRIRVPVRARPLGMETTVDKTFTLIVMGQALGPIVPRAVVARAEGDVSTRINLGAVQVGKVFEGRWRLTHREGRSFQVLGVELVGVDRPDVHARYQPWGTEAFDIAVYGKAAESSARPLVGQVRVRTDVEGLEELLLFFQGVVR